MDTQSSEPRDLPAIARERVQIAPPPDWIQPCPYSAEHKPALRGPVTYLLVERQVHAELRQTYVRTVQRLETMQAVQHQSQWRLEFEPQTQSVLIHSIKIRRDSNEIEHADLGRMQFLQREARLEGWSIDGWITLLLLLENVRPGDILDWSYTLTDRPRLLPDRISAFFTLPAGLSIGKYHFSIQHAPARNVQWKSSSPNLAPVIQPQNSETRCCWQGENFASPEPEDCTPDWHLDYPWIQVSDCPDWQTFARAVVDAWTEEPTGEHFAKLIEDIKTAGPDPAACAGRAIELVQDGFRYLSVSLELGGQIPAGAESVIRRRYGDCKDLAFLLVRLLRTLGISARPILVNAESRLAIGQFLPSPGVFNHAIVEFQIGNERRWVDATIRCQGGGALNRSVPDYGLGLPIDATTLTLVPVPAGSLPAGNHETKESFNLDTSGQASDLEIIVTASGIYADMLRQEFEDEGVEAIAKKRLQLQANRFAWATRVGTLQFRDDRVRNEFTIAEGFEIHGFLKQEAYQTMFSFHLQSDISAPLLLPSANLRRNPFSLPFPCQLQHIVQIEFPSLNIPALPACKVGNEFFSFSRISKSLNNFLKLTFSFNVLKASIPADRLPSHRAQVEPVWKACNLVLELPPGYFRIRRRLQFGNLPKPSAPGSIPAAAPAPARELQFQPDPGNPPALATAQIPGTERQILRPAIGPAPRRSRSRSRSRSSHRSSRGTQTGSGETNRQCTLSLWLFLTALGIYTIAIILDRASAPQTLSGIFFLLVIPFIITSVALAIVGLGQCYRNPERYGGGKGFAFTTLVLACFTCLFLVPAYIEGIQLAINGPPPTGLLAPNPNGRYKFESQNFEFRAPPEPWEQLDPHKLGKVPILAFEQAGPILFALSASPLDTEWKDPSRQFAELSRSNVQASATGFRLLSQGSSSVNGMPGWQVEFQIQNQGRDYYLLHWLITTNGFGYQLAIWGPPEMKSQIQQQGFRIFACFEPD